MSELSNNDKTRRTMTASSEKGVWTLATSLLCSSGFTGRTWIELSPDEASVSPLRLRCSKLCPPLFCCPRNLRSRSRRHITRFFLPICFPPLAASRPRIFIAARTLSASLVGMKVRSVLEPIDFPHRRPVIRWVRSVLKRQFEKCSKTDSFAKCLMVSFPNENGGHASTNFTRRPL